MSRRETLATLARVKVRKALLGGPAMFAALLSFVPAAYQLEMLTSTEQFVIVNCCRQAGKTTAAALIALYTALIKPGAHVLVFAAKQDQSAEFLVRMRQLMARMPVSPEVRDNSKIAISFVNGSRVVCYPSRVPEGGTIRGPSPDLVIHDEAAFAPEALFRATSPMVARSRGRIFYLSTPNGPSTKDRPNFFHDRWVDAQHDRTWRRIEAPWQSLPPGAISGEHIAHERKVLGTLFPQEYECQFLQPGVGLCYHAFNRAVNVVDALPPLFEGEHWTYLMGVDPGFVDATGYVVCCYRPHDPVLYACHAVSLVGQAPTDVGKAISEIRQRFPVGQIAIDTKGAGKGYESELLKYAGVYCEAADWSRKAASIHSLNGLFASAHLKVLSSCTSLIEQLESVTWNKTRTAESSTAKNHETDALLYIALLSTAYLQQARDSKLSPEEANRKRVQEFWQTAKEANRVDNEDRFEDDFDPWGYSGYEG